MLRVSESPGEQAGARALLDAISKDKIHLARFILDALDGRIVNARSERAQTPLISAVLLPLPAARSRFVRLLLERGARVNWRDEAGRTALSYACERGFLDSVKTLVQNNADPELADVWGNTALIYAAVAGRTAVVEFLVRAFRRLGLEIDRPNQVGNSAVEVAEYLGHRECVLALTARTRRAAESGEVTPGEAQGRGERRDLLPRKGLEGSQFGKESSGSTGGRSPFAPDRDRSAAFRKRLESMGSIDEEERDMDRGSPVPNSALTPSPRLRSSSVQYQRSEDPPVLLPPLVNLSDICTLRISAPYSPRPVKSESTQTPAASTRNIPGALPHTLGILLTPIAPYRGGVGSGPATQPLRSSPTDPGLPRFNESYYQKRCSLPTSALSPSPPGRLLPSRKSKALPSHIAKDRSPPTTTNTTTFAILGSKLFRRFTFSEFRKSSKDRDDCSDPSARIGESGRGMSRSETFPLSGNHPQVVNKPSVDSISGVKCEFDFQLKNSS
ncbi:ankyrin repeat domain-containing protein 63 [Heptranchias perlo]|uniref:ankyrin repeat domain-containing protein 63 n=1 Tax=Heptranchias perlo TaxID=212740 RepID=UPI003559EB58